MLIGTKLGIALNAIKPGMSGPCAVTGIWTLPCSVSAAVAQGAKLYWNASASHISDASADNIEIGIAAEAIAAEATACAVRL